MSTTATYKAYPAAAAGISRASSGGAAWSNSSYTQLVPVSTITSTFYIAEEDIQKLRDSIPKTQSTGNGGLGTRQVNDIFDRRIPVSATAPINPTLHQLWVDIS